MNIDFTPMFTQLSQQITALAKSSLSQFKTEAEQDATRIVNIMKADLQAWGTQLAAGQITTDDLQLLINNGKTLMTLTALEEAGLTQIRVQQFLSSLLTLIYNTLITFIQGLKL